MFDSNPLGDRFIVIVLKVDKTLRNLKIIVVEHLYTRLNHLIAILKIDLLEIKGH